MAVEGLSAAIYLDECAPPRLAADLRDAGFDVVHAWDVGNWKVADDTHLRWATSNGYALLTFDIGDFELLAADWTAADKVHAGIVLSTQKRRKEYGQFLRRVLTLLDQWTADELANQVVWLPTLGG